MRERERERRRRLGSLAIFTAVFAAGCWPFGAEPEPLPPGPTVGATVPPAPAVPTPPVGQPPEPIAGPDEVVVQDLTVTNADLRSILPLLAEAAGVSLVLAPEIEGRITLHLQEVPAGEALARVLEAAGLRIGTPAWMLPWSTPTIFYPLAVNVNTATAEAIQARFGVSEELARFLVRARIR